MFRMLEMVKTLKLVPNTQSIYMFVAWGWGMRSTEEDRL